MTFTSRNKWFYGIVSITKLIFLTSLGLLLKSWLVKSGLTQNSKEIFQEHVCKHANIFLKILPLLAEVLFCLNTKTVG